jgi:predicted dehydrogenase
VVTGNAERRAEIERRYPGTEVLGSAEEVFARAGEFDLAVVTTPNGSHVALARAALEAGLHVVVDKPLAGTAAQGRELFALAASRGLLLQAYQNRRWDGDFRTLRELVARGALGEVRRFESRFERWRPEVRGGWKEDADPAALGGILYDLGSHLVDQAVLLLGRPEGVYAELEVRRPGAVTCDDAFLALRHAGGVVSHLWMSAVAPELGPRLRVLGARAAYVKLCLDVQEARLREGVVPAGVGWGEESEADWGVLGDVEEGFAPVRTLPGAYQDFYRGVAAAIRDGAGAAGAAGTGAGAGALSPVMPDQTVAVLEVLDAAMTSAETGRTVRL